MFLQNTKGALYFVVAAHKHPSRISPVITGAATYGAFSIFSSLMTTRRFCA